MFTIEIDKLISSNEYINNHQYLEKCISRTSPRRRVEMMKANFNVGII